jgi:hypothetical protein
MRVCKPSELGLIFGQGGPSTMGWSGAQLESTQAAANLTPTPSTPTTNAGGFVVSPGTTTVTTGTNQFGERTITITSTTYGSDNPQAGSGGYFGGSYNGDGFAGLGTSGYGY